MDRKKLDLRRRWCARPAKGRLVIFAWAVVFAAVLWPASPSSAFAKAPAKAPAKADVCPAYPRVWSWGAISHQRTIDFVGDNHGGDWAPYNGKWKKRLGLLEMAHAQGRTVVFPKPQGLRLRGRGLAEFIEWVRKRIDINLCLAEQAVEVSPETLAGFATAAGPAIGAGAGTDAGVPPKTAAGNLSAAAFDPIRLRVIAECTDGAAVFKVINIGGRWPRTGTFTIYTLDGQKWLSKRRLRLARGQRASFKFKSRKTGEMVLGLWVDPSWYSRDFRYDAKVICG
ncbi:MAG: hypothetical protein IIA35_05600 [Proteobacteria bacterium]|nr:hypothetical protein [Pseudomonadota bacterium]